MTTEDSYLAQYSNEDVEKLLDTGSLTPNIDGAGNLLVDYFDSSMASSSITIPLESIIFDPVKVEEKYDVVIREFSTQ